MISDPLPPWTVLESVIDRARHPVVTAVEISRTTNLRWAVSMPTTNGDAWRTQLTITAVAQVTGGWSAATRSGDPHRWQHLLAEAEAAAQEGSPATEGLPLLSGFADRDFEQPPDEGSALDVPEALREAFAAPDVEVFGYAEEDSTTTYVATSTGWRWREVARESRLEISAKADQRSRSAWVGLAGDSIPELDAAGAVADVLAQLEWQRRQVQVPAQPTSVILTPSATADLMLELWRNAVARDAAEGHSAFSGSGPAGTKLGDRLSPRRLTLSSDPLFPGLSAPEKLWTPWSSPARSVFDTGSALPAVNWIADGQLNHLAATRAAAAELDLPFVASPDCLSLHDDDGAGSVADLVSRTDHGLLVTSLWYIRDVDPQSMLVTGLTRDGCYQIVNGEIVGAAGNFRFNDSPLGLLTRIDDVGETARCLPREWADYFTRTAMPAMRVADFGLSTPSIAV